MMSSLCCLNNILVWKEICIKFENGYFFFGYLNPIIWYYIWKVLFEDKNNSNRTEKNKKKEISEVGAILESLFLQI